MKSSQYPEAWVKAAGIEAVEDCKLFSASLCSQSQHRRAADLWLDGTFIEPGNSCILAVYFVPHKVMFTVGQSGCHELCYAVLCYAMLCYAMLCYAMLCYAMLTLYPKLSKRHQKKFLSILYRCCVVAVWTFGPDEQMIACIC